MITNPDKRVVITGIGPICSLGFGCDKVWKSILDRNLNLVRETCKVNGKKWAEFYLHKMRDFDINNFSLPCDNFKFIKEIRTVKKEDLDLYYFLACISLAIENSQLKYQFDYNDIGLVIAHENPGMELFLDELIDLTYSLFKKYSKKDITKLKLAKELYKNGCEKHGYNLQTFSYLFSVAKIFDIHGYSLFLNNACASGLYAIETASRQIKAGVSPVVIVAAVDNPTKVYKYLWFNNKGLYAKDGIIKPFSKKSNGIVFGDGGAALVLEDLYHAQKRNAHIYAEYLGGGFSLEGWKITVPNIREDFYTKAFRKALEICKIAPEDIDFINPHGVGLKITDAYEAITINSIFKDKQPLVSAFKPLIGHNLGGSALIEIAIALLSLKNNYVPATLNCDDLDEKLNLNIIRKDTVCNSHIMAKMSCGFAGFNGVGIFRKIERD
jgi:3-oxoacyl-(acyl-carrier-protein) synthase